MKKRIYQLIGALLLTLLLITLLPAEVHAADALPAITGLSASNDAESGKPMLVWDAAEDAVEYQIYRKIGRNGKYAKLNTVSEPGYTDETAEVGVQYYYRVRFIDADGNKSAYCSGKARTCDLPQPEMRDVTNYMGPTKVRWFKVDGAKEYSVYRATSEEGPYTKIGRSSGGHLTVKNTDPGVLYYYKVKAIHENSSANSAYSDVLDCPGKLHSVNLFGLESNVKDSGHIKLTWKSCEGAEGYQIIRRVNKKGESEPYAIVTENFFIDTDVVPGNVYEYRAQAIHSDSRANSGYGSSASQTCDLPRPVVEESNVKETGKVLLEWNAIEGAKAYEIYRRVGKTGTYEYYKTITENRYVDEDTTAGTAYYYKVRALHKNSNAHSAKSVGVGQTCDLPQPAVSSALGDGYPVLSWETIEGAESYAVYRADAADGAYEKIGSAEDSRYADETAAAGKTYYYKVKAICENTAANSAYSAPIACTV